MRRVKDERGAVAVVVALVMVPLIAFAAISLDVAGMWWERQQLQTAADAGALAIAQDCGRGPTCGTPSQTAQSMVTENSRSVGDTATVLTPGLSPTTGRVSVRTNGVQRHLFAPILGVNSTALSAQATVAWGGPSGGTAMLPLAFSWCEWKKQTGGGLPSSTVAQTIYLTKSSQSDATTPDCTGPSGNIVPGGFGWLTVSSGSCGTKTVIGNIVASDPGNSVPSSCSTTDFAKLQNKIALLPIFDAYAGTGSGATYRLNGYAAFQLTGYHFGGQYGWNDPCNGNARCVRGYFTRFVTLDEAFTYSATAPTLGASVVRLTS
ncbi:MAG: pilus assembly protein TadG-related protein [Friedmanniella sp.]